MISILPHSTTIPFQTVNQHIRVVIQLLGGCDRYRCRCEYRWGGTFSNCSWCVGYPLAAIAAFLALSHELLILDEPTAVLTPQEVDELFGIMRSLKAQGKTIIFITHKLQEVMAISDVVTVMRRGKVVGSVQVKDTSRQEIANMMVGRQVLFRV